MSQFADRMLRAAKLDADLYEEVEADHSSMGQAMAVVVLSSLAAGIGAIGTQGAGGIVIGTIGGLLSWFIWAFLTALIGTKLLPEEQTEADTKELLRTIGFSSTPGLIRVFGVIPGLLPILNLIAAVWMLVAMVVAVRQALDYNSTGRAVAVCGIGWLVQVALLGGLFILMGGGQAPA